MVSKTKNTMMDAHGSTRTKVGNEARVSSKIRCIDEDLVPMDMVIEILKRLPVKSIVRFLLMSKFWLRIIRSQDFIRSFPSQPQPSILLALKYSDKQKDQHIWEFFSYSTTSRDLPVSYLSCATCSNTFSLYSKNHYRNEIPHYVNGLVSLGYGKEQNICNPSARKSITLPNVKSRRKIIQSFFGYDPIDGLYKVLCMSNKLTYAPHPSYEHQVFTLGVDKSWRMIECNILHRPISKGLCIKGVVYYVAYTGTGMSEWCLARFDVRSEIFDQVVQILGDHATSLKHHFQLYLISYKGKVTLAIETEKLKYELWVLEDAEKHEWSKVCFTVNALWDCHLSIRGYITHTDEIVFVARRVSGLVVMIVYYDHKELRVNNFVKVNIHGISSTRRFEVMVPYLDHVESAMLL